MSSLLAGVERFLSSVPGCDYWTLRVLREDSDRILVRQGVLEPTALSLSQGALLTVVHGHGVGYAATADLSLDGLRSAWERAADWAAVHARLGLFDAALYPRSNLQATEHSRVTRPWADMPLGEKTGLLVRLNEALAIDRRIVDWSAWLAWRRVEQHLFTSEDGHLIQIREEVLPGLETVANAGVQTQSRHGGGTDAPGQGGLEQVRAEALVEEAGRLSREALALLDAPECPSGRCDLVLLPSQMQLQIHESIGHPLELDRILGDERNYAGTSFVTPEMFGTYRYGSGLLNVTFDPTVPRELASSIADDDGTPAQRAYLIRDGILERPLGGVLSQRRAGLAGVACSRASGWDRPPIDRMGNINLEPGRERLADMIARVERGILMETNRSWSIDDSRNKFQFGCEIGRRIVDGEVRELVRNPGYRGIAAEFWRSLDGVGGPETRVVGGVLNCGKGEPNQSLGVGHASPACLFRDVAVFGGGE